MASRPLTLTVYYLAYSASSLDVQSSYVFLQNLISLSSFQLTQEPALLAKNFNVRYKLLSNYLLIEDWFVELLDSMRIELVKVEDVCNPLIPLIQVEAIVNSFHSDTSDCQLFLDGDTTFIRPYVHEVAIALFDGCGELAMAHECGSTGVSPYPNYNCGFIMTLPTDTVGTLFNKWRSLCNTNRELVGHGNQRLFPYALRFTRPKILTIDNVYNLRCHQVFGGASQVWSPVYMVHSHELTRYMLQRCRSSGVLFTESLTSKHFDNIKSILASVDEHMTPRDQPFLPRYISCPPLIPVS